MKTRTASFFLAKPTGKNAAPLLYSHLLDLLLEIPASAEHKSSDPRAASQTLARSAALKAASVSGALALPPGPLGWATLLPDLVEVWRIQSQMVSDIAALHGKSSRLKKESLLFCLFRHGAAALTRDLVVRVGRRIIIPRMSSLAFRLAVQKLGGRVTRSVLKKTIARSFPLVGALAVGGYAYYDTSRVAATAIELFGGDPGNVREKAKRLKSAERALANRADDQPLKTKVAAKARKAAGTVKKKASSARKTLQAKSTEAAKPARRRRSS